jgi:hypothetical protein
VLDDSEDEEEERLKVEIPKDVEPHVIGILRVPGGPQIPSHAIGWTLVSPDYCPDDNKWYCLFLPSTNCSVPSRVTNANKKEDFVGGDFWMTDERLGGDAAAIPNLGIHPAFYTSATAGGEFMGKRAKLPEHQWSSAQCTQVMRACCV